MTYLRRYIVSKALWYALAFVVAMGLNFLLPRLIPGNPVDALIAQYLRSGGQGEAASRVYQAFLQEFGLDEPMGQQFVTYVGNVLRGNLGTSFSFYPARVTDLIAQALPWTVALQLPAILIGWILGNLLGALAAYKGGKFDRTLFVGALAVSSIPYYAMAILLLYFLAVVVPVFPVAGGYSFGLSPNLSVGFIVDLIQHYTLPFLSLVLIAIGGQAVGMRSMAIYELGADYVNYASGMGVKENTILRYVFRNAMLPQVTGLALSLGTMVGGALITELVFSYPGIGYLLFNAISLNDYPLIQGVTLFIATAVLLANFLVDLAYGFIDPRIRAVQMGER
ncbi:ABC transporter permease [Carboxydochorda subterranea]|uniref:ABC transporter permease n=1 Tax=Carboxydichorda subterranea TaxID=3109565 RepID=A0ABZ1BZM3_9FIRM|nr:ABC transporter permease [Limnochorda sp. L945t]WRP17548.1 ABC transporter permease [Limnochorda sp. L945t]